VLTTHLRLQLVADALQFVLHLPRRDDMAVGLGAEVELHAGLEAPFERHLVDGDGALALVHRRMEVIGRVEMRAVMGRQVDVLDRPALAVGQILFLEAGEEAGDLAGRVRVLVILDLGPERHGIGVTSFSR
jgi:hypothetical protein